MPILNMAFLNPKNRSSKGSGGEEGVSVLRNQIQMYEDSLLGQDGILSPGDYDLLIELTQKVANNPVLTPTQRSSMMTKISGYEKNKAMSQIEQSRDIQKLESNYKNNLSETVINFGNDPYSFNYLKNAALTEYMNDLEQIIRDKEANGITPAEEIMTLNKVQKDYYKSVDILNQISEMPEGSSDPLPGYVAYVKTNRNGEIVDIDYDVIDSKSGYFETDVTLGGFQIYGMPSSSDNGERIFKIGNESLRESQMMTVDSNGMPMMTKKFSSNAGGVLSKDTGYRNISPDQVPVQNYIPHNSFARSSDGQTLYKRNETGYYTKYLNTKLDQLGIDEKEPIMTLPRYMESTIQKAYVNDTIDSSLPEGNFYDFGQFEDQSFNPDIGAPKMGGRQSTNQMPGASAIPNEFQDYSKISSATQRTTEPKERASTGFMDTAKRTVQGGINAFKSMLG